MTTPESSRLGNFELSFSKTIGMKEKDAKNLRDFLDKRLVKTLNMFPFSDPNTLELPILQFSTSNDKVFIPDFPKAVSAHSIEKIMDNVIISRSNFTKEFKFGPKNVSRGGERGQDYAYIYKTLSFPVVLEDLREYIVVKGMNIKHKTDKNGKLIKEVEYIGYFAKLRDNGMDFNINQEYS